MTSDQLSFFLFADGPCDQSSFHPDNDESQYWCRRDALARITSAALWFGQEGRYCNECVFIFPGTGTTTKGKQSSTSNAKNETSNSNSMVSRTNHEAGPTILSMASSIRLVISESTEQALIRLWKEACSRSSKQPSQSLLINNEGTSTATHGSVVCSFEPWKEAQLYGLIPSASANIQHNIGDANATKKRKLEAQKVSNSLTHTAPTTTTNGFDKRAILRLLQGQCPIDFLREFHLNGPESLVLKKSNRASIESVYNAWLKRSTTPSAGEAPPLNAIEMNRQTEEEGFTEHTLSTTDDDKLYSAIKLLLYRIILRQRKAQHVKSDDKHLSTNKSTHNIKISDNRTSTSISTSISSKETSSKGRVTLLFLHEDYPHELDVFGSSTPPLNHPDLSDMVKDHTGTSNHHIVCMLGAVRDTTDGEVRAAIKAATSLGVRCVGANLGRLAEFTSKIVTALVGHAACARLSQAVDALPSLNGMLIDSNSNINSNSNVNGNSNVNINGSTRGKEFRNDETKESVIEKLTPIRGWTWDGSKTSKSVPTSLPSTTSNPIYTRSSISSTLHFHAIVWVPMMSSHVTLSLDKRGPLRQLVQVIVCTLWRSRLACEVHLLTSTSSSHASSSNTAASSSIPSSITTTHEPQDDPILSPTLSLVFAEGLLLTITRSDLALAMANNHMAAPSEYQVLNLLISLINAAKGGNGGGEEEEGGMKGGMKGGRKETCKEMALSDVLESLLPSGLRKRQRKMLRVVLIDPAPPPSSDTKCNIPCLSDIAYKSRCWCSSWGGSQHQQHEQGDEILGCDDDNSVDDNDSSEDDTSKYVIFLFPLSSYTPSISSSTSSSTSSSSTSVSISSLSRIDDEFNKVHQVLNKWHHSKKSYSKLLGRATILPLPVSSSTHNNTNVSTHPHLSPAQSITLLQHFAYHGRLYKSVQQAVKAYGKAMTK